MLTIANDLLPNNELTYLAFRISCLDTIERLVLARQFPEDEADGFGYLTEVPFLRSVPPTVQLDLLSMTWHKHQRDARTAADLVDESVVFAACETTALITERSPEMVHLWQQNGPQWLSLPVNHGLQEALRNLHLSLSIDGDFLLISQFEDLPPFEALRLKAQFGLQPRRCDTLFEALGRWHVTPGFAGRLTGLLTDREIAVAVACVKSSQASARSPNSPA